MKNREDEGDKIRGAAQEVQNQITERSKEKIQKMKKRK